MNYYYLFVVCLLISIFIYCQIRIHRKFETDYQILQVSDPEKNILEDTINQKYPTVLTDVVVRWKGVRDLEPNIVQKEGNKLLSNPKFVKLLNKYFNYYHMPMSISRHYSLKHYNKGDTQYITRQNEFRFYIVQIHGESRFILFSPQEEKYLYATKDRKVSKLNFWKLNHWDKQIDLKENNNEIIHKKTQYLKKFPKFNKAKYIEVVLHPGNMFYIPYNWWYTSYSIDENIRISASSRNMFSW
jgi:hypothetical protein